MTDPAEHWTEKSCVFDEPLFHQNPASERAGGLNTAAAVLDTPVGTGRSFSSSGSTELAPDQNTSAKPMPDAEGEGQMDTDNTRTEECTAYIVVFNAVQMDPKVFRRLPTVTGVIAVLLPE